MQTPPSGVIGHVLSGGTVPRERVQCPWRLGRMRILITGATGFIGSALAARLTTEGHEVISVSRSRTGGHVDFLIDMARASPADWSAALEGVEAVVNCAGVFQSGAGDSAEGVHVQGAQALYTECEQSGVRRVIHISAAGIDRETPTAFSRTKQEGEQALWRTISIGSC